LRERLPVEEGEWSFADRPRAGAAFRAGDPVATVLAGGDSQREAMNRLKRGGDSLRRRLTKF
jgi:predicted ATP-grasp superfamily ATP-dependent carboligase